MCFTGQTTYRLRVGSERKHLRNQIPKSKTEVKFLTMQTETGSKEDDVDSDPSSLSPLTSRTFLTYFLHLLKRIVEEIIIIY